LVDQLVKDLKGRANVLRVSIHTDFGRELSKRYDMDNVPLFIILDSSGNEVSRARVAPGAGEVPGHD
jgi:hypothetical protein